MLTKHYTLLARFVLFFPHTRSLIRCSLRICTVIIEFVHRVRHGIRTTTQFHNGSEHSHIADGGSPVPSCECFSDVPAYKHIHTDDWWLKFCVHCGLHVWSVVGCCWSFANMCAAVAIVVNRINGSTDFSFSSNLIPNEILYFNASHRRLCRPCCLHLIGKNRFANKSTLRMWNNVQEASCLYVARQLQHILMITTTTPHSKYDEKGSG